MLSCVKGEGLRNGLLCRKDTKVQRHGRKGKHRMHVSRRNEERRPPRSIGRRQWVAGVVARVQVESLPRGHDRRIGGAGIVLRIGQDRRRKASKATAKCKDRVTGSAAQGGEKPCATANDAPKWQ